MARPAPAIDLTVALVTFLAAHPGRSFTLSDLARRLDLNKATAHRMLEKRLKSRGFAGAALGTLFVSQRGAVAEPLTEAAVRAVGAPSAAVARLASEVTKMALLRKLRRQDGPGRLWPGGPVRG